MRLKVDSRSPLCVLVHGVLGLGEVHLLLELALLLDQVAVALVRRRARFDALHLDRVHLAQRPAVVVRPLDAPLHPLRAARLLDPSAARGQRNLLWNAEKSDCETNE